MDQYGPQTIEEIRTQIERHRPVSLRQVHRYFKRFKIKPCGARQRPQIYPADSAKIIIKNLGLNGHSKGAK